MSAKKQFLKSTVKLTGQQADRNTRRSVSGSCIFYGGCLVYSSSRTQKIVSLSSAELETYAAASAVMDAILIKVILCWILQVRILMYLYLDSSAARGILSRRGVGRLRHLSCRILWLQDLVNERVLQVKAVLHSESSRHFHEAFEHWQVGESHVSLWSLVWLEFSASWKFRSWRHFQASTPSASPKQSRTSTAST